MSYKLLCFFTLISIMFGHSVGSWKLVDANRMNDAIFVHSLEMCNMVGKMVSASYKIVSGITYSITSMDKNGQPLNNCKVYCRPWDDYCDFIEDSDDYFMNIVAETSDEEILYAQDRYEFFDFAEEEYGFLHK